jgi:Zn-dependent peptidase ImmA (M78 family)
MLLPGRETSGLRFLSRASLQETIEAVAQFAHERNVSRPMVAYKLLRVGIITNARWRELDNHYEEEWHLAQTKPTTKDAKDGGPSYYVVKRHRLGHALLDLVKNALAEGFLTHTKAGQVLGVKPRNVDPLISVAGMRGSF